MKPPRYDDVYWEGVAYLDQIAFEDDHIMEDPQAGGLRMSIADIIMSIVRERMNELSDEAQEDLGHHDDHIVSVARQEGFIEAVEMICNALEGQGDSK